MGLLAAGLDGIAVGAVVQARGSLREASVLNIEFAVVDADLVTDTFAPVCIKLVSELIRDEIIKIGQMEIVLEMVL